MRLAAEAEVRRHRDRDQDAENDDDDQELDQGEALLACQPFLDLVDQVVISLAVGRDAGGDRCAAGQRALASNEGITSPERGSWSPIVSDVQVSSRAVPIPRRVEADSTQSTRCSSARSRSARPTCTSPSARAPAMRVRGRPQADRRLRASRRRVDPHAPVPHPHDRAAEAARDRPADRPLVRRARPRALPRQRLSSSARRSPPSSASSPTS